ncbi:MAG: hydantoinase/carbamoylase family amidase [Betaproteobacteria bacterium]|nr:hydantoinase/carbamoylase family amidase [Betaproteobacteria bacterium]
MSAVEEIRVRGDRLWESLMALARIGATERGGVRRLALTDEDRQARELVVEWCRGAGLAVTVDRIGNIFARREGDRPDEPPVLGGSHIDTQPSGGRFDGNYGVLAMLEVVRTLDDYGIRTRAPVELAIWTNEEGTRFQPVMMGSGVFAGIFPLEQMLRRTDLDGRSVGAELKRIGFAGQAPCGEREIGAYFEAHIEQGPVLEDREKTIGVVTGVMGLRWFQVTVTGQDAHAGPTPMHLRRDAMLAAAHVVDGVNRIACGHGPHGRATVGYLQVKPNSINVVPGEVRFSIDVRHADDSALDAMESEMRERCAAIADATGTRIAIGDLSRFAPTRFDPGMIQGVRAAAERLRLSHMDIVSGAGHDAVHLAAIAPTGMIFVPCEGGISHNESENARPEDLEAGCNVLLHALLERAGKS